LKNQIKSSKEYIMETLKEELLVNELIPLYSSDSIQVSLLSSQVMIMQLTSFEPQDNFKFLSIVDDSMKVADLFKIPYLILDLRSNGGGDICLGYQVISALMEEKNPFGKYDIIHSKATSIIVNKLAQPQFANIPFSPSFWVDPQTGKRYKDISWYSPGHVQERANIDSTYSNLVHLYCPNITSPVKYLFKQILILTDGLCGSTCAVFSSHLGQADHVNTIVIGGLLGKTQQYFSFPGGEVFNLQGLREIISLIQVSDPSFPSAFKTSASLSFTLQEIYPWNKLNVTDLIPLEFQYRPATHHLTKWNFESNVELYTDVASYFGSKKKIL